MLVLHETSETGAERAVVQPGRVGVHELRVDAEPSGEVARRRDRCDRRLVRRLHGPGHGRPASRRVAAVVDVAGISNVVTFLESTKEHRRDLRRVEYGDEREPVMRALLGRISPLDDASKLAALLFVAQAKNARRVPLTEAEQIVTKLRAEGDEGDEDRDVAPSCCRDERPVALGRQVR